MVEPAACKRGEEMQVNSPLILKGWALPFLSDPVLVICFEVFFFLIILILLIYLGGCVAVYVVLLFILFLFFPRADPVGMYFYLLLLTCEPCSASCSFLLS